MATRDWEGFERGEATKEILTTVAGVGGIFLMALLAPGAVKVSGRLFEEFQRAQEEGKLRRYRAKIKTAVKRLEARRLVEVEKKNDELSLTVTELGKRTVKRYDTEHFSIQAPEQWDGRWRIVGFDIPEKYKPTREALRELLKRLEFYPLQKSVWIIPWPCRNEIEIIRYAYGLERELWFCETDTLDREVELREHFGLLTA